MKLTMKKRLKDIIITAFCVAAIALTAHYHYYVRESYVTCADSGVSADERGGLYFDRPYARLYRFLSPDGSTEFIWTASTEYVKSRAGESPGVIWIADPAENDSLRGDLVENGSRTADPAGRADGEDGINGNRRNVREIYYIPKAYVHFRFSDDPEMAQQELADIKEKSELLWRG